MEPFSNPVSQIPAMARGALRPLALLTAGALSAALGAYWLVLVPAQENVLSVQRAYDAERQKQVSLRRARTTQEHVLILQDKVRAVWQTLPTQRDFEATAIKVAELGRSARVSIPGMNYQHEEPEDALPAKASLSFRVTGRYYDLYRFIHRLENMQTFMVIKQLDASRAKRAGRRKAHDVELNISVMTFLKPDQKTAEAT